MCTTATLGAAQTFRSITPWPTFAFAQQEGKPQQAGNYFVREKALSNSPKLSLERTFYSLNVSAFLWRRSIINSAWDAAILNELGLDQKTSLSSCRTNNPYDHNGLARCSGRPLSRNGLQSGHWWLGVGYSGLQLLVQSYSHDMLRW